MSYVHERGLPCYSFLAILEEAEPHAEEHKGYNLRMKLAFQWVEAQGEPWWLRAAPTTRPKEDPELRPPSKIFEKLIAKRWVCSCTRLPLLTNLLIVSSHPTCVGAISADNPQRPCTRKGGCA